jgi:hypothetical protein
MTAEFERLRAAEARAETVRAAIHLRETVRQRGVAWSGLGPEPFRRRSPGEINTAAMAMAAALEAWRASRRGRLNAALARVQALARAAHAAAEQAQAALARDADGPCPLSELSVHATALLAAAREAIAADSR